MKNNRKWYSVSELTDYDKETYERHINMPFTFDEQFYERNVLRILRLVQKFNDNARYLYGISPNGYAYTCGCSHDCCGCLCSMSRTMTIGRYSIVIRESRLYNY